MQSSSREATVPIMSTEITIGSGESACAAYLAMSQGSGKYPCLILIEEIWGVDAHIKDVADRFAREGFIVLAPELLPGEMLSQLTPSLKIDLFTPEKRAEIQPTLRAAMAPMQQPGFAQATIAKLEACMDYLIAHGQGNGNVGVLGFCFGGTYSFHLAVSDRRLDACVVFYGQSPAPLEQVEKISCPILALYGEKDENIVPSLPALEAAMKQYGKDFSMTVYPGVGHAFFNDTNPRTYNSQVAQDAWQKSLAFLHKHLES